MLQVIRQRIKHGATGTMTRMDRAADAAMEMFADYSRRAVPNVLLVLSDGLPTGGYLPGTQADKAFKKARANGAQVSFVCSYQHTYLHVGTDHSWHGNADAVCKYVHVCVCMHTQTRRFI